MLSKQHQSGFALLFFMLILLGLGGLALTGVGQSLVKKVEEKKVTDTQKVLEEAKQALLMFAYNYHRSNPPVGPGRLPCPDITNDGLIGTGVDEAQCNTVGRLPWFDDRLNFYDATDSSGERLWYAVSEEFRNFSPNDVGANTNGDDVVNSDSVGTISVFGQSGNLLYDGAVSGIAAVIIAPGPAINGQDRLADPLDPANYLDSFNGFDNSAFVNAGNGNADGFILGPVVDPVQNAQVINDQIIFITAEEVTFMAEKAVLETYQEVINQYKTNIWGTAVNDYRYPWLNSFPEITTLQTYNPGLNTVGRIPSFFSTYFTNEDSGSVFSDIEINYDVSVTINETNFNDMDVFNNTYVENGGTASGRANLAFSQINTGQLSGTTTSTSAASFPNITRFFWDEKIAPDGWEACPQVTFTHRDCHRDGAGGFVANPATDANQENIRIRQVTLKFDFDLDFTLGFDYVAMPAPTYTPPTTTNHALINADFSLSPGDVSVVSGMVHYVFDLDNNYNAGDTIFSPTSSGTISATATAIDFTDFDITLDYFPELPSWAGENSNNWNSSIWMGFANGFAPGATPGIAAFCTPGTDCLTLENSGGIINDKAAIMVLAGDNPDNAADISNIFEGENDQTAVVNTIFDLHPTQTSDDILMVLQ